MKAFDVESWYIVPRTQCLPSSFNLDPKILRCPFTALSNVYPSCCGNTERMLHGIYIYAVAALLS